jgi:hypothetical protein
VVVDGQLEDLKQQECIQGQQPLQGLIHQQGLMPYWGLCGAGRTEDNRSAREHAKCGPSVVVGFIMHCLRGGYLLPSAFASNKEVREMRFLLPLWHLRLLGKPQLSQVQLTLLWSSRRSRLYGAV